MSIPTILPTCPSVCPLDCPDTCSLKVTVEGDQIIAIKGSDTNPYTRGTICKKVANYYIDLVHGPRRVRTPLLRTGPRGGDQFQPITWPEALDHIYSAVSAAIDEYGAESILPLNYGGPHGQLAMGSMDRRFFYRLGASQLERTPLCGGVMATAYASLFGDVPGLNPEDAVNSDLLVVWANNITTSNLHFTRVIQAAQAKGARLVVVDSRRIKITRKADLFLQPRPNTDTVLALAMAAEFERRNLLDNDFLGQWVQGLDAYMQSAHQYSLQDAARICGLKLLDIEQFVELYAGAMAASLNIGIGLERSANGGSAIRAVMALQVLRGQLGHVGAGIICPNGAMFPKTPRRLQRPDLLRHPVRKVNIVDVPELLLDETLDPPFKVVFIYNHNPVCTHPQQNRMKAALARESLFTIGSDVVMTESMAYCDIILPACSHFEHTDIFAAYGQGYLQKVDAVIPAVGEALPNTEIFRRLAARFGFEEATLRASDTELLDAAFDSASPAMQGQKPSLLPAGAVLPMLTAEGAWPLLCANVRPATDSGRIELYSQQLAEAYACGVPDYQPVTPDRAFILVTPSSFERSNATFGGHPGADGPEPLELHPDDALASGIAEQDLVRVWNDGGEVVLQARLSHNTRPGVLYSPKGAWLRSSITGQTVNALIPAHIRTDILQGAAYNETFVDIGLYNES